MTDKIMAPNTTGTQPPSRNLLAVPIRNAISRLRKIVVKGAIFQSGHFQTKRATIVNAIVVTAIVPAIARTYALASADEDLNAMTNEMLVNPTNQFAIGT